jgi:hypothetical protein
MPYTPGAPARSHLLAGLTVTVSCRSTETASMSRSGDLIARGRSNHRARGDFRDWAGKGSSDIG